MLISQPTITTKKILQSPIKQLSLLTTLKQSQSQSSLFQHYSCTGILCSQNGSPLQLPSYCIEPLYFTYLNQLSTDQCSIIFSGRRVLLCSKLTVFRKRVTVVVGDIDEIRIRIEQMFLKEFEEFFRTAAFYLQALSVLNSRTCLRNVFGTHVEKEKNPVVVRLMANLQKSKLSLKSNIKAVLFNDNQLVITNSGNLNMQIELTHSSSLSFSSPSPITSILQNQLQIILQLILGSEQTPKQTNLHKIQRILESPYYNLQFIGGVSCVKKINVREILFIKDELNNESTNIKNANAEVESLKDVTLAKKCLKPFNLESDIDPFHQKNNSIRFHRQLEILQKLGNRYYLLNYYYHQPKKSFFYIQWCDISLSDYLIEKQNKLNINQMLDLSIQIVLIIQDLHLCGIVHRDLKPSNFMVKFVEGRTVLKLIDFGDAFEILGDVEEIRGNLYRLYSTSLFCPLETSTFNSEYEDKGINQQAIDNWSVGVILFKIFHGNNPITYSSTASKDIHNLWNLEFTNQIQQTFTYVRGVNKIIDIICFQLIKMKQEQRMNLNKVLAILLLCRQYLSELKQATLEYYRDISTEKTEEGDSLD